jgi:DNA (cytosine-5)-methyltransferase 1
VLQAFPSWWEFSGRQSSRFRQIGNAVPPLLAQAVAEQVAADLASADVAAAAQAKAAEPPALLAAA